MYRSHLPCGSGVGYVVFLDVNLALHKLCRRDGIDSIGQVVGINDSGVFADEIIFKAEGFHFACVDVGKGAAVEWVAEEDLEAGTLAGGIKEGREKVFAYHCGYS